MRLVHSRKARAIPIVDHRLGAAWALPSGTEPIATYRWGGFRVASNMPLPRLVLAPAGEASAQHEAAGAQHTAGAERAGAQHEAARAEPDAGARIEFICDASDLGDIPPPSRRWTLARADGSVATLAVGWREGLVRYEVEDAGVFAVEAARVRFAPTRPIDPANVEHLLVNSALPIAASLGGVLALHAAAVERDGEARVYAGPSGVGKSTMAAGMIGSGWRLLGDDVAVLRREAGAWRAYPTSRTLRAVGLEGEGWDNRGKVEQVVASTGEPATLERIVLLGAAAHDVRPSEALASILPLLAGWQWIGRAPRAALVDAAVALLGAVPVEGRPQPHLSIERGAR